MRGRSPRYRPAWWLPGPHSATLWGRFARRRRAPSATLEQWSTPDGDFVELLRIAPHSVQAADAPRVLVLHGLEGGRHSHYVHAIFSEAVARGWAADLLFFRTCGSVPNRLPRSYHSGETTDARFVIETLLAAFPGAPLGVIGISLGGNVLCKLLGEWGSDAPRQLVAAAAISTPFDLAKASRHIGRGFGAVYERAFLRSLIPKALAKVGQHDSLRALAHVRDARTIWEFDERFTAPLHGFASAADYYAQSSALGYLHRIRLPTLLLNAVDDPFLPASVLREVETIAAQNSALEIEFPARGGHVGFTSGWWPWAAHGYGEWRAAEFLAARITPPGS